MSRLHLHIVCWFYSIRGYQQYQRTVVHYVYVLVGCKHRSSEVLLYIGGRGLVSQIIEPVTFARCAFIIALRNIALNGYLDTRRNI